MIGCNCVENSFPLLNIALELNCPECGVPWWQDWNPNNLSTCGRCGFQSPWAKVLPKTIVNALDSVMAFINGVYDDKTEEEMAEDISEKLWSEE